MAVRRALAALVAVLAIAGASAQVTFTVTSQCTSTYSYSTVVLQLCSFVIPQIASVGNVAGLPVSLAPSLSCISKGTAGPDLLLLIISLVYKAGYTTTTIPTTLAAGNIYAVGTAFNGTSIPSASLDYYNFFQAFTLAASQANLCGTAIPVISSNGDFTSTSTSTSTTSRPVEITYQFSITIGGLTCSVVVKSPAYLLRKTTLAAIIAELGDIQGAYSAGTPSISIDGCKGKTRRMQLLQSAAGAYTINVPLSAGGTAALGSNFTTAAGLSVLNNLVNQNIQSYIYAAISAGVLNSTTVVPSAAFGTAISATTTAVVPTVITTTTFSLVTCAMASATRLAILARAKALLTALAGATNIAAGPYFVAASSASTYGYAYTATIACGDASFRRRSLLQTTLPYIIETDFNQNAASAAAAYATSAASVLANDVTLQNLGAGTVTTSIVYKGTTSQTVTTAALASPPPPMIVTPQDGVATVSLTNSIIITVIITVVVGGAIIGVSICLYMRYVASRAAHAADPAWGAGPASVVAGKSFTIAQLQPGPLRAGAQQTYILPSYAVEPAAAVASLRVEAAAETGRVGRVLSAF